MKRIPWVLALIPLVLPAAVAAQSAAPASRWTITLELGIHTDRMDQPERFSRAASGDLSSYAFTTKGEAPTIGLRATRWLGTHVGLEAGLAAAHNDSWQGAAVGGQTTPSKLTLFSSVAPVLLIGAPAARLQLQVGAGPALITHTGSGELLLTRGTDVGGMALADASARLSRRVRLVLGARNYRFTSTFKDNLGYLPSWYSSYWSSLWAGNRSRSEWMFQSGLRLSF